jgi:hypothetical protein
MSVRFLERIRLWAAAAVVAAVAGGLSAVFPPAHAGADSDPVCPRSTTTEAIAEPGRLVTKFDLTAFRDHKSRRVMNAVHKWAGQIRIKFVGTSYPFRDHVERVARDLSCLTNIRIYIHEKNQEDPRLDENFHVFMFTRDEFDAFARREKLDAESLKYFFCYLVIGLDLQQGDADDLFTTITIVDDLSEAETRHCFVRLMTRALGLFAGSDVVQPSIFSPDGAELDYLPINDKIILRTLYDPRIKQGMKREEAMEIAGGIIPELVKAVRERGVEALYQR